jgi:hypothetical protein
LGRGELSAVQQFFKHGPIDAHAMSLKQRIRLLSQLGIILLFNRIKSFQGTSNSRIELVGKA